MILSKRTPCRPVNTYSEESIGLTYLDRRVHILGPLLPGEILYLRCEIANALERERDSLATEG